MNYHRFLGSGDVNRIELFGRILYMVDASLFGHKIFPVFFAGHALITLFGVYKFINTFSEDRMFSVFVFFTLPVLFFSSLNLVRQWAAVGLLYSIFVDAHSGKKVLKMWPRLVLLPMIHLSSIVVLPLFLAVLKKWNLRIVLLSCISLFFLSSKLLDIALTTKYGFYIRNRLFTEEPYSLQLLVYPIFLIIIELIIQLKQRKTGKRSNYSEISKLVALSSTLMFAAFYLKIDETIITRVGTYFFLLIVVLLPMMFSVLRMYRKVLRALFLFFLTFLFLRLLIFQGNDYALVPYRTYFY